MQYEIKMCLIVSFISKNDRIDGNISYKFSEETMFKECLIIGNKAIDIENNFIYEIIDLIDEFKIDKELELNKLYVYKLYPYDDVKIDGKLFAKPRYSKEETIKLAQEAYENYIKIVPYEKFLKKKKEKHK